MRVVFFGTPEFALPSLGALLGEGFDVVAVVTQPDKPQGRSRSTAVPPPVKTAAEAEDVPVLQPARPSDPAFVERLRALAPDVGVVVAYGHILKPDLLALPRHGMINLHPSLLPELRGAAPVEWAILNGLKQTGVTIMQMDEGLDSGPILLQIPHDIDFDVTGGELSEHLSEMGAQALVEALALFGTNGLEPHPQEQARATYAPKLTRETARIRWADPAEQIARLIRALDPRPGAWTELDAREVKLFGARVVEGQGAPGEVRTTDDGLRITTGRGAVAVDEVQPAGKAGMAAAVGAAGVQLGHGSLAPEDARRLNPAWWIGKSVHDLPEAEAAHAGGADYLLVGPVFPTATHADRAPLGSARLKQIVGVGLPVIAIGGVTPARIPELRAVAAIHGVAAIRALWDAADPADAARRLLEELNR